MGGGVSLGTFCGGALGEAVRVLWDWNRRPGKSVEIDVCAGASAGAISLAMMLRTLANPDSTSAALGSKDPASDPGSRVKEAQRYAWVRQVDIEKLAGKEPEGGWRSVLDRSELDRIAEQLLAWTPGGQPDATLLAPRILLHNALTNLNGLPYESLAGWADAGRTVDGSTHALTDALSTAAHKDRRVFDLRFPTHPDEPTHPSSLEQAVTSPSSWEKIAGTALACGAFPLAFEPVVLEREAAEYPALQRQAFGGAPSALFSYCDGGVLENDPMGDALALCRAVDEARPLGPNDERLVVYIDPNVSGVRGDRSLSIHQEKDFVTAPRRKAAFLGAIFGSGASVVTAVMGQAQREPESGIQFDPNTESRYTMLGIGPLDPDAGPAPAGFEPEPELLWGAAGANFAGFLDSKYRRNDFFVGERHAHRSLRSYFASRGEPLQVAEPTRPGSLPRKRPDDPESADVLRKRLRQALADAIPMSASAALLLGPLVSVGRPILDPLIVRLATPKLVIDQDEKEIESIPVRLRITLTGLEDRGNRFFHLDKRQSRELRLAGDQATFETTVEVRQLRGFETPTRGEGVVHEGDRPCLRIVWRDKPPRQGRSGKKQAHCDIDLSGISLPIAREVDSKGKGILEGTTRWQAASRVPIELRAREGLVAWRFPGGGGG